MKKESSVGKNKKTWLNNINEKKLTDITVEKHKTETIILIVSQSSLHNEDIQKTVYISFY